MRAFILAIAASVLGTAPAWARGPEQQQQAAPSPPRTYAQADLWDRSGGRINFRLAGISLPVEAGATRLNRSVEASHEGQGLDNALLYYSPDEAVFATVYIYSPALADAGLTAFTTDSAIHVQSGDGLRVLGTRLVAAGGREGSAIRSDYAGFRQERLASSAAFIRVGHWILKIRVSGPEARRADVERTMTALLDGLSFNGRPAPTADTLITAPDCPPGSDQAAHALPINSADAMEDTIMSHYMDSNGAVGGVHTADANTPRPAPGWCRSTGFQLDGMAGRTLVLRATSANSGSDTRRAVLVALIADNGTMLEVAERRFDNRTRYILIHHQIGRTMILSAYDRVPTDAQLGDILSGRDREGGQARARIDYQAGGDSNITLMVPMETPAPANTPRS